MNLHSVHFELSKLADGVYAAIATESGGSVGNAGFVDLGDQTIVFDTFNTQQAAEELKKLAESLTGNSVSTVINSHWHGDHIRGNQVFADSIIISSHLTYNTMKKLHPERIAKQQEGLAQLEEYIQSLKQQKDEHLNNKISFLEHIQKSLPTLTLTLPHVTFERSFHFHGSKRSAQLITLGGGHSICDSFLYLPDDDIAFLSDLLFVNTHPSFLEESDVHHWIHMLEDIEQLEIKQLVPGHGPIGDVENIRQVKSYIQLLTQLSETNDEVFEIPSDYAHWASPEVFHQNMKLLMSNSLVKS
ncbi:MBL fold metallo-hydrolase [Chungangia koreensis]|uniref:MBL fold metallo-hydrolase n=1 Tax=Chungangia koreensis TaxID=752657 RepID=A0ABV8X1J4_9LACT